MQNLSACSGNQKKEILARIFEENKEKREKGELAVCI